MEIIIGIMLRECGILPTYTGYKYLIEAIGLVYVSERSLEHITKDVYPELAQRHNASIWMIETNIRNAIQRCWGNAPLDRVKKYFPGMEGGHRPTNTAFIEGMVKHLRAHNDEDWKL